MSNLLVEIAVWLLLIFTPLAFGGVELWAQGVIQIVAGLVAAVWAWRALGGRGGVARRDVSAAGRRAAAVMWIGIAGFLLLVALQTVPLPPDWVRVLSPAAHSLYARALPGYAEGRGFDISELPAWTAAAGSGRIPGPGEAALDASLLAPPMGSLDLPTRFSSWRTLSVSPFDTRQRLTLVLCYVAVFAASSGLVDRDRIKRLIALAVAIGFAVSVLGILQKLTWNGKIYWIRETTNPRFFGPFANWNSYAAYAVTLLPVAGAMSLWSLCRLQQGRRDALPQLVLWTLAAATMAAGVFYSMSRGGMIAAVLSLLLLGLLSLRLVGRAVDLVLMAVLAAAAAGLIFWIGSEKVLERMETISAGSELDSVSSRLDAWQRALDLIGDYPLTGSGYGTFRYAYMPYAPPGASWWSLADNEYVELLCDTGVSGGLLLLVALGAFLVLVARPSRLQGTFSRYAFAGLASGLLGLALHSVANADLHVPANALLLVVFGASLRGLCEEAPAPTRPRAAGGGPRPLPWERARPGETVQTPETP